MERTNSTMEGTIMKHLPTTVLLDLAEEVKRLSEKYGFRNSSVTVRKLTQIDEELLSRIPAGEFVTMLGGDNKPVGFEPYVPDEDSDWLFDALYGHIDGIPTVDEMG